MFPRSLQLTHIAKGLLFLVLSCASTDIWPKGPGSPLVPQAPTGELRAMLAQIDPKRVNATITKLVSFGTRHTLSSQTDPVRGIGAARDWLAAEMRSIAAGAARGTNITISIPSYIQQPASRIPTPTNISDVVATIHGASDANRMYVITGHYDSRVTDIMNFTDDAPGADDDASGVAVVLELLRIMSQRPPPAATIVLGAVAGEEQGLYGSDHLAQVLFDAGADVQGMFTNDIVGSSKGDDGTTDPFSIRLFGQGVPTSGDASQISTLESIGGENDSPARELVRFVHEVATNDATGMKVRVIYRLDRFLRGGDHEPFLERGFPAARFTEPHENFAHQHQDVRVDPVTGQQFGDLIEFCDFDFIARVAKVNGAALWSLAQAPGTPKNVTIDTAVLTNNSTLSWELGSDVGLAGYEVLWRPTIEPFWTNVIPVGLVSKVTVDESKDNVVFGVRAVGKNGYRSPAALPFPG
ncbi:Zn-dependent exopeptidase [Lentinus tigrinus ALCF2SS1-7]|uniref:Zn-dependent exopeptidase n=1 Tax=Lentinus tigrinus ALCF2SS1-7 TaxID=1328758 RepID=UPI00116636B6|nr:Zn-dependent exopeptidase [Lentinus tigrinus ALCF2SS1-7]